MKLEELVGKSITEEQFDEAAGKKDACYHKVKARYDVWPSAYASGALVKCRKVGAANWGNKSKKEGVNEDIDSQIKSMMDRREKMKKRGASTSSINSVTQMIKKLRDKKRKMNEFKCLCEKCWKGYEKKGTKKMFGKTYPNCVKKEGIKTECWIGESTTDTHKVVDIYWENNIGESCGYTIEVEKQDDLNEAEYQGRKVKLGKIMQGDTKKFKVYVKNPKGNVVKVNFGHKGKGGEKTMRIRKSNPEARKSFRARHNCDNPGPRHKARYWSCRKW